MILTIPSNAVFKKAMTSDQIAKSDLKAHKLIQDYRTLQALRKSREFTQVEIAECLGISQENISRMENRPDVLVSTLRKYVETIGGELDLVVRFPDSDPIKIDGLTGEKKTP